LVDQAWFHKTGSKVDLVELAKRLETKYGIDFHLRRIFAARHPELDDDHPHQFLPLSEERRLQKSRFQVKTFSLKKSHCCHKFQQPGSVDAALCMAIADCVIQKYTHLVLIAGDGTCWDNACALRKVFVCAGIHATGSIV
jgi:hypothetical protein